MSRKCMLTGAQPSFGHNVSHSQRKTKRRWDVNIQNRKFYVPSLGRTVNLRLSTRALKTVDKRGIDSVVQEIMRKGVKL